jgi:hypothetical protein
LALFFFWQASVVAKKETTLWVVVAGFQSDREADLAVSYGFKH